MLPDLIRRGRQPTVGITASKATITLRIAAEGATEEECFAAMEPTVATIRQCLGTLVFGEEDDELAARRRAAAARARQDAGHGRMRHRRAWWPSGLRASRGRATCIAADWFSRRRTNRPRRWRSAAASSSARIMGWPSVSPLPPGEGQGVRAVNGIPSTIALASSDGVQQKRIPCGIHPALLHIYIAKHALNFVRLALVDGS